MTLRGKHCRHPIAVMGVVDTFQPVLLSKISCAGDRTCSRSIFSINVSNNKGAEMSPDTTIKQYLYILIFNPLCLIILDSNIFLAPSCEAINTRWTSPVYSSFLRMLVKANIYKLKEKTFYVYRFGQFWHLLFLWQIGKFTMPHFSSVVHTG